MVPGFWTHVSMAFEACGVSAMLCFLTVIGLIFLVDHFHQVVPFLWSLWQVSAAIPISSPWVLLAFEALCELPCVIHLSPLHVMSFLTFFYWVPLPGRPLFLSSVSIPSFKRPLNNFSRMSYFSKPLVFSLVCWVCSVHLIWFLKSFVWLTNWK